jgi:hypothetical protein
MMEAVRSSEKSENYYRLYGVTSQKITLFTYRRENLNFDTYNWLQVIEKPRIAKV